MKSFASQIYIFNLEKFFFTFSFLLLHLQRSNSQIVDVKSPQVNEKKIRFLNFCFFLGAAKHLYKRVRPSVRPSVGLWRILLSTIFGAPDAV